MSSFLKTLKVNTLLTKNQKLIRAVYKSNHEEITRLLQSGADVNSSTMMNERPVLSIACERNDITAVHLLLEYAPDVNKVDIYKHTPIMFACMHSDLTPVVEELVSRGASVNQEDNDGKTAFFFAAMYGCISSMEFLLSHGANIDARDKWGKTPLICTVETKNQNKNPNFESTIEFLLANGANVTIETNKSKNVLAYAEEEGVSEDTIGLLESHFPIQAVANPALLFYPEDMVPERVDPDMRTIMTNATAEYTPIAKVRSMKNITGGRKRKSKAKRKANSKAKRKTIKRKTLKKRPLEKRVRRRISRK